LATQTPQRFREGLEKEYEDLSDKALRESVGALNSKQTTPPKRGLGRRNEEETKGRRFKGRWQISGCAKAPAGGKKSDARKEGPTERRAQKDFAKCGHHGRSHGRGETPY